MMSPIGKVTVIIADDTLIAREGWKRILGTSNAIQVIGEAITARQAVHDTNELKPDIVLMDLKWYGDETAGWAAIREMKATVPQTKVIAITAYEGLIRDARRAGADSALLKTLTRDELLGEIYAQANRPDTSDFPTVKPSIRGTLLQKIKDFFLRHTSK